MKNFKVMISHPNGWAEDAREFDNIEQASNYADELMNNISSKGYRKLSDLACDLTDEELNRGAAYLEVWALNEDGQYEISGAIESYWAEPDTYYIEVDGLTIHKNYKRLSEAVEDANYHHGENVVVICNETGKEVHKKNERIIKEFRCVEVKSQWKVYYTRDEKEYMIGYVGLPTIENILGNTIGDYTEVIKRWEQVNNH